MDGANWRPTQGADPAAVAAAGGVDPNAPAPAGGDWRAQLHPEARSRIVNKIMETLKNHLPVSVPEELSELRKIAVRFEEKIYTAATNQSDYLRKISLKILSMESPTKSQQNPGNAQVIPNPNPPGPAMGLFSDLKRLGDGVVPMPESTVRQLGVDFGKVECVFFAAVQATNVDRYYLVNHVLRSFIPGGNFSIAVHANGDIFVNCKTGLNRHLLLHKGKRFGTNNVVWFSYIHEIVRMEADPDNSQVFLEDNTFATALAKHRKHGTEGSSSKAVKKPKLGGNPLFN